MDTYIIESLELHLFFGRIMKEHSFFLEVGFVNPKCNYTQEARWFKEQFEELLCYVTNMSKGLVRKCVYTSGEVVTKYTLQSEMKTCQLTGAQLDTDITRMQQELRKRCDQKEAWNCCNLEDQLKAINERSIELLQGLIALKEKILKEVLQCKLFTANYPLLIDHIIREAKLYLKYVMNLESFCKEQSESLREIELFWNRIMMEHAQFIRGLLDPTEADLIKTADGFANDFAMLLNEAKAMTDRTMEQVKDKVVQETIKYRDFKEAGAKGINGCEIRSLILPLLADHVLREANHYLRLLEEK